MRQDLEADIVSLAAHVDGIYPHVHLDVLDPSEAIATNGQYLRVCRRGRVFAGLATIARQLPVRGTDISSYDPTGDQQGRGSGAACKIVEHVLKGAGLGTR